jgi:hypothetical protein
MVNDVDTTIINFAAGNASNLGPFYPFLNTTFLSDYNILALVSSHQENPIKSQSLYKFIVTSCLPTGQNNTENKNP